MKYFFTVFALSSLFAQNELIVKIDSLNALKDLFNSQALTMLKIELKILMNK